MKGNHARKIDPLITNQQVQENKTTVIVHRRNWITKGEKILYTVIGLFFLLVATYLVYYSSTLDSLNRDVQKLEQSVQMQQAENQNLIFEIKELSTPERITQIAKDHGLKIQDGEVKQAHVLNK